MMHPTDRLTLSAAGELVDLAAARAERAESRPIVDDFAIIAPIARGGMGGVYLATDRRTGDTVALKILEPRFAKHDEIVQRMFGEHRVSQRVQHANLVTVRDARRSPDGMPYLVLEFLDGENLGEIAERGRMEVTAIVGIAHQVALGVAALHAAGVVHCDLKPDNVFVLIDPPGVDYPNVKVIDYGVAVFEGEPLADDSTIAGTPACMAPEQWMSTPSAASDVYALGCLLYELLTGEQVFCGTLPALMTAHTSQLPPRASWSRTDTPPELDALISRALAKTAALRPTMREMADALFALLPKSAIRAAG